MALRLPHLSRKTLILPILLATAYVFYTGLVRHDVTTIRNVYITGVRNDTRQGRQSSPVETTEGATNLSDKNGLGRSLSPIDVHRLRIITGQVKPEDLMKAGPFEFLRNYRNPCWKATSRKGTPIKCLPYFYLMGAPKAGTTDLYSRIIRHPSVLSRNMKEPHWLPRKHYYANKFSQILPKLDDYLDMFSSATQQLYHTKDASGYHGQVFGDGSASTLWDNDYWTFLPEFKGRSEPLYTNADYIHHLNPHTKLIAILRNPIDRLYSDYLYFDNTEDKGPAIFHDAVVETLEYMNECLDNRTLRDCVYHRPPDTKPKIRLRIGIYHVYLEDYFRVFPRDQLLLLKLEDYSNNASHYMQKVFQFLQLEPIEEEKLAAITKTGRKNIRRPGDKAIGGMLPDTRTLLYRFYYPYNERLVELLGKQFDYNNDA